LRLEPLEDRRLLDATGVQTNSPDEPHPAGYDTAEMHDGSVRPLQDLGGGVAANHNSGDNPHPIITVETTYISTQVPTSFDVALAFNDVGGLTTNFSAEGVQFGSKLRFAMMADATTLPTGRYPWTMQVKTNFSPTSFSTRNYTGTQFVLNRNDSPFGGAGKSMVCCNWSHFSTALLTMELRSCAPTATACFGRKSTTLRSKSTLPSTTS